MQLFDQSPYIVLTRIKTKLSMPPAPPSQLQRCVPNATWLGTVIYIVQGSPELLVGLMSSKLNRSIPFVTAGGELMVTPVAGRLGFSASLASRGRPGDRLSHKPRLWVSGIGRAGR